MVEWYFKNQMNDGKVEVFDGVSLIEWTSDDKILFLKEFGCNINNYMLLFGCIEVIHIGTVQ